LDLICIISPHFSFGIPPAEARLFQIFAVILCDLLWFSKNKAAHDGIIHDVMVLANSIKKTALEHYTAWKIDSQPMLEKWSPPLASVFKINFDTAIRENLFAQSAICWDSNGLIIKAISQINPLCDPNYGEALVALLASSLAVSLQLKHFILEGDSLVVILALSTLQ
jgi:hypothetical protein